MLEIECLVCGKIIDIPEFIDINNYEGQIACRECGSLLQVRLVAAKVRKYEVVQRKIASLTAPALSAWTARGTSPYPVTRSTGSHGSRAKGSPAIPGRRTGTDTAIA